jgi:hypothetical protein
MCTTAIPLGASADLPSHVADPGRRNAVEALVGNATPIRAGSRIVGRQRVAPTSPGFFAELGFHANSLQLHMLRMRAPTSTRTCRDAECSAIARVAIGQVTISNNGNRLSAMKRVREA